MERPPVSVIVPYLGDVTEGLEALSRLKSVVARAGDELLFVDNSPTGDLAAAARVLHEPRRSPYTARNTAARAARNDWLLFVDADCRATPGLLDAYFTDPVPDGCGAVAGEIVAAPEQTTLAARHARLRGRLQQAQMRAHPYKPLAVTANLLVRREAWAAVGGFCEGVRSGADADFCWRLQDVGWTLELRPGAVVEHFHRETVRALLRQVARDSGGSAWLERRHPGAAARPKALRESARAAASAAGWLLRGEGERARMRALDGAVVLAERAGYLASNAPDRSARAAVGVVAGDFPAGAEPLRATDSMLVEAARQVPDGTASAAIASFAEDDGTLRRWAALAELAARHPRRFRSAAAEARLSDLRAAAPAARRVVRAGVEDLDGTGDARALAVRALAGLQSSSVR